MRDPLILRIFELIRAGGVALLIVSVPATAGGSDTALPPFLVPAGQLAGMERLIVREFIVHGNTVISDEEILSVTEPYIGQDLSSRDLFELKNRITKLYIDKGYITSGVLLHDQEVSDGRVVFQIVEGVLGSIEIQTDGRLHEAFIRGRVENGIGIPLNINDLQKFLRILQQNPLIKRVDTQLAPGIERGKSLLYVAVAEAEPVSIDFLFNNYRSPSIGSYRGELGAAYRNLTGWGDMVGGRYGLTEGLNDYSGFFAIPLNRYDTLLTLRYEANDSTVVTRDFDELDIDSDTNIYGIELRHPVFQTQTEEFAVMLKFEQKKSETFLLGEPFSFSQGVVDGVSRVSVLSIAGEWIDRTPERVITCRSQITVGVDWLNATIQEDAPDGEFITWLSQYQSLHRLNFHSSEILIRGTLRLSNDELLPLEKFAIGGRDTVRGYRENELTRDNGFLVSMEYRVPIGILKLPGASQGQMDGQIQFSIFGDYGISWDRGSTSSEPPDIGSVGVGFRWFPGRSIHAELYWGYPFRKFTGDDEHDLQDDGIHFQVGVNFF